MSIFPCQHCGWMAASCTCRAATNRRVIADVHQRHREARERAWRSGWAAALAVARSREAA